MKICKFCKAVMLEEFETISCKTNRYKGYYNCPECGALCDDEVIEKKGTKKIVSEKWISPCRDGEKNDK